MGETCIQRFMRIAEGVIISSQGTTVGSQKKATVKVNLSMGLLN
jgi:hypothetical protein